MNVILLTQDISMQGGVANYFNILKDKFHHRVDYFFTGSRTEHEPKWRLLYRFLADYLSYLKKLHRYDLVHLNTSLKPKSFFRDGIFLLLSKFFDKKVLLFIHGWNKDFERTIEKRFLWLYKLVFFKANCIIVLSSEFKRKLVGWGYTKDIFLFTTAVDDRTLQHFYETQISARIDGKKQINILFLSRLEREKGLYILLDAFAILKNKFPDIVLTIVGDGPEYEKALKDVARLALKDVHFTGFLQGMEKIEALKQADIFCFPSFYGEGMPTAVLEAMAFGLPVVTRAVGGLLDFFQDGKMGIMTQALEPEAFAEAIELFIKNKNLRRQTSLYNYHYARSHFLASQIVRRLESVYEAV